MSMELNDIEGVGRIGGMLVEQAESGIPEIVLIGPFVTTRTTLKTLATSHRCRATASGDMNPA